MSRAVIRFFLDNKLVTALLAAAAIGAGVAVAPFDWRLAGFPRSPVPVDAIPDIGENQQIVFTEWMGRSPRDIEDHITYPLSSALLGMPGVTSIRSTSMFGLSSIAVVFGDDVEYYWSRARVLEKLAALPAGTLPDGVTPALGPDATALGQVFWYTLEGRDAEGNPVGGWDPQELRSLQDFHVRPALSGVSGVAEVASVGGFVTEVQVDLDPAALSAYGLDLMQVAEAVRASSLDAGAGTLEINRVEYLVRGIGNATSAEAVGEAVVGLKDGVPVRIRDIGRVTFGPAPRGHGGILDKGGAEAVGGVVTARHGENPLRVISGVQERIAQIAPGLPRRTLEDGRMSTVTVVPFYDRSGLIRETLATLYEAIGLQLLVTLLVIVVMVLHLRAALAIAALLPLAVLLCFVLMRVVGVDANVVALSGIAIAIGAVVDLGIILTENVLRHRREHPGHPVRRVVLDASSEVSGAILTAVATTIVSFLPVFALQAAEGKLFGPLAYTKTFTMGAAVVVTFVLLPSLLHVLLAVRGGTERARVVWGVLELVAGLALLAVLPWAGIALLALGAVTLLARLDPHRVRNSGAARAVAFFRARREAVTVAIVSLTAAWLLADLWRPLTLAGAEIGMGLGAFPDFLFVAVCAAVVLGLAKAFLAGYAGLLRASLRRKGTFLAVPAVLVVLGLVIWTGFDRAFGFVAAPLEKAGWNVRASAGWSAVAHAFPGLGTEFMPALDEGSFLLMPTSTPHAGAEANRDLLRELDLRVQAVPEVELVVGKAGRAETALDPAPLSMFENIIHYVPEYGRDAEGNRVRLWRDHIRTRDDIWDEIVAAVADVPAVTSAPKLQPIETRLVMLQTGMRAPMGVKVFGPDVETIEAFSLRLEEVLRDAPSVRPEAVYADRGMGKAYIEVVFDRAALALHGLTVGGVQHVLETAVGGMELGTMLLGRERRAIRVRYAREWRDSPEALARVLVATPSGAQVPLGTLASVEYRSGPMMIRSEDSFPVGYVLFDAREGVAQGDVARDVARHLRELADSGGLEVPQGVSWRISGAYENQLRAERRLAIVVPAALLLVFLILHLQFRSVAVSLMVLSGVALSFAGGFILLWLYGLQGFLDFGALGINLRELLQVRPYNLSVAVWVGFIALFGIAVDNGVVLAAYLRQRFAGFVPRDVSEIRAAVLEAAQRRVRPCLMTTATTLLALLPVLTSRGRGSDIMIPMAIPAFGGMLVALLGLFLVPVLYAWMEERRFLLNGPKNHGVEEIETTEENG